jgi:hypothetical protein
MNFDNLKRSLAVIEVGLNKANLNGAFELNESYTVKMACDNLKQFLGDVEKAQAQQTPATVRQSI